MHPHSAIRSITLVTAPVGGIAEYAVMDADRVCLKPDNFSFEEASAVSISFDTALGAVRKANITNGQKVMIYGASGGVGLFAVQLAKIAGAEVTGVCSTRNIELMKSAGCDRIIDYKKENFTKTDIKYDAGAFTKQPDYLQYAKELAEKGKLHTYIDK